MKAMELTFERKANLVEIPKPTPKNNEILVKVASAALDTTIDAVLSKSLIGKFTHASAKGPLILGWHFAGTVVELGPETKGYKIGDKVWGHLQYEPKQNQGSFAEYITVEPDACAIKPENVSFRKAAAAATESTTALQAMRDEGGLQKGKTILINGAGGGVGSLAVRIAKRLGAAKVTAVCSTKDVKRVKSLGADEVIDRTKGEDPLVQRKYDVIFDTPNALPVRRSLGALASGGSYVATLPSWGLLGAFLLALFVSKKVTMIGCKSKKEDLELIGSWLEDGLEVTVDSYYRVIKLEEAVARQSDRSKLGRVVVDVEGGWE